MADLYSKPEVLEQEEGKTPAAKPSRANVPLQSVRDVKGQEYRIVLLGRTGAGKSATGNTIFGEEVFGSKASAQSITSQCTMHKGVVQNDPLLIVDTPGLFDTHKPNKETKREILKLLTVVSPGPHAIILVIPIHQRYTPEMRQASEYFQEIFGIEAQAYTMVLFTGEDNLEADDVAFQDYIDEAPPPLMKLLAEVKHRYVPFNNRTKSNEKRSSQIQNLMGTVKKMVQDNGGSFYSNDSFQAADTALEEIDAKRVNQLKEEKMRKLDALRYPSTNNPDLGMAGTVQHEKNYKKQCGLIAEEFNQKIGNARQDVRQSIVGERADIYDKVDLTPNGWFLKAVKKVALSLGFNVE